MIRSVHPFLLCLFIFSVSAAKVPPIKEKELSEAAVLLVSDPVKAESILLEIIQASPRNPAVKGKAHQLMATICVNHSRKGEEIEHLFKSYWFYKEAKDIKLQSEALRLIGNYYIQMNLTEKAEAYLSNAFDLATEAKDTLSLVRILSNNAQLAGMTNDPAKRLKFYEQAIELSQKINYREGLLLNWNKLSYAYWFTGQPEKMLSCMKEAMKYKPENGDTLGILYGDLGLAYMEVGALDSAEFYLDKGMALIRAGRNIQQEIILTKYVSNLRAKQNRTSEALRLMHVTDSLRKKLFTDQLRSEVSYAETKNKQLELDGRIRETMDRDQKLIGALAGGLVLLGLMTFFVIRLRNNNRVIHKQKVELDKTLNDLTERESLLRQLFDSSPSLILTHTMEGKILSCNEAVLTSLQLDRSEIMGKSILDFISSTFADQFNVFINDLVGNGTSNGWLRVVSRTGITRILRYQSKVIQNTNQERYVISFALDDTDAFDARMEADHERNRMWSVMENSPDIYSILKADGTIQYMNRSNFFNINDIVGKNIRDFLSDEQGNQLLNNLRNVHRNNVIFQSEETLRDKVYLTKLIPILSDGEVHEVLTINIDVTEIRKREERERELNRKIEISEKRYRHLVEESKVLICTHTPGGDLLMINKPGAQIIGFEPDEITGKNLREFLPDEFHPDVEHYLRHISINRTFEGFMTVLAKDGSKRIFLFKNAMIDDGPEPYILGSAQDVTEWRKAEYREQRIKQELQLAKEVAEESNRLKTIFLGNLSHEVRTPLQAILGFSEILENVDLPVAKRREYINIIKRRTADMQNVIESLLDLASLETGEIKAYSVEVNLSEFIEAEFVKAMQDHDLSAAPVQFLLENIFITGAVCNVDPQHLHQVLTNLLSNAFKFIQEGTITLAGEETPGDFRFSITDTGIGIEARKLDDIFKPFRQAHEGLSRSKGGIGLGLSICKKMIDLWGGQLTVLSEPGKGSTFSFTIPKK